MSMTNWGSLEYRLRDSDSLLRDINVSNIAAQQEMDCLMSYVLVSEVHVLPCQARLSRMRAAPKGFANTHTTRTTVRIRVHKKRSLLPATPKKKDAIVAHQRDMVLPQKASSQAVPPNI